MSVRYFVIAPPTCLGQVSLRRSENCTYTSTGVRPPWVTEQQTAPAKANLE
jgi:hypothetical protein